MTLKIGNSQSSNNQSTDLTEKSEPEKLLSNSAAENEAAINFLANQNPAVRNDTGIKSSDEKKTVGDFLRKVKNDQPFDEKTLAGKPTSVIVDVKKPVNQTTVADYDKAIWRAIFKQAGYGMLTDQEIALAVGGMNVVGWKVNDTGLNLPTLRAEDSKPGVMTIRTTQGLIEKAKRAGQAVLQYQEYRANQRDAAIESGKTYVNGAIGGFVQPLINAPVNIVNGISEPFRAGEKMAFGTNYILEIPKMKVAENSEYWKKDGRIYANKGAEIVSTVVLGGATGSKAMATQTGRILTGIESGYNVAAGITGTDVTQTDEQGNARQMEWLERGTRIAGGLFGARQTVKSEISASNSAVNKLDDVFKNPPTINPQAEFATPNGVKVKINENTFEKPLQTADDLNTKIVTVDSNGNPSGTRFRSDYEDHIKNRDYSNPSQKNGVNGCHNMNELEKFDISVNPVLTKDSIKIINKTSHPSIKGIYKIEYQMPALDKTGQPSGLWRNKPGNVLFEKTVYDSKIISSEQMAQWSREAFADAVSNGYAGGNREWIGIAKNGLRMMGYIDDKGTSSVRTSFPIF